MDRGNNSYIGVGQVVLLGGSERQGFRKLDSYAFEIAAGATDAANLRRASEFSFLNNAIGRKKRH